MTKLTVMRTRGRRRPKDNYVTEDKFISGTNIRNRKLTAAQIRPLINAS